MRHPKVTCVFFSALFFMFSCIETRSILYKDQPRSSRPSSHPVEIIDRHDIKRGYKVIGQALIIAERSTLSTKMKSKLFEQTRQMGGDAITDLEINFTEKGSSEDSDIKLIWKGKIIIWIN